MARYQRKVFGTARKYSRHEDEVEDMVQEVFLRAYRKLRTFRFRAPFEHWLMRLAVRICYDGLRRHQRSRERSFSDMGEEDCSFLERFVGEPEPDRDMAEAARALVHRVFEQMSPAGRMILTLQEIEGRSIKEIAALTGWSLSLVKVRGLPGPQGDAETR